MGHFWQDFVNIASIALDADASGPSIDVRKYNKMALQANLTPGGGSPAGNLALQGSLDGTNWATLAGTTQAYTSSVPVVLWDPVVTNCKYLRVNVDTSSGTGGTAQVLFSGEWSS